MAKEFGMSFYETSAVNNTNVDNAFMTIVGEIKVRLETEPISSKPGHKGGKEVNLKAGAKKPAKGSSWC